MKHKLLIAGLVIAAFGVAVWLLRKKKPKGVFDYAREEWADPKLYDQAVANSKAGLDLSDLSGPDGLW